MNRRKTQALLAATAATLSLGWAVPAGAATTSAVQPAAAQAAAEYKQFSGVGFSQEQADVVAFAAMGLYEITNGVNCVEYNVQRAYVGGGQYVTVVDSLCS